MKNTFVSTKKNIESEIDMVVYSYQTGDVLTAFDRYPDWLKSWVESNATKFKSHYVVHNLPDLFLHDDNGIVVHDFRVGDIVVNINNNVQIGQKALFNLTMLLNKKEQSKEKDVN